MADDSDLSDDWTAFLEDDDDDLPADADVLVDRLGPAFAAHHRQSRLDAKRALAPVLQHTQQLHDAIQSDILPRRTQALARLDHATLRFENTARRDMAAAQSVYDDAQHTLDALFSTLDDLVRQSDLLFHTFKTSMLEHVQRLRHCATQMPLDSERLTSSLEKKAKHLGAQDHAKAKENLLRGILEKY